jgi:hypothetical protein
MKFLTVLLPPLLSATTPAVLAAPAIAPADSLHLEARGAAPATLEKRQCLNPPGPGGRGTECSGVSGQLPGWTGVLV